MNTWIACISTCVALVCIETSLEAAEPKLTDVQLMEEAASRIEKHRKGDVKITVVNPDGTPVADAGVELEQMRHAFLFGCNIFCWGEEDERYRKGLPENLQKAYRERFVELFNYATLPVYWHYYEPKAGEPRDAYMMKLAEWCTANNVTVKGHPLMWNYMDPAWIPAGTQEVAGLQVKRVTDIVGRFAGKIDCWDVANELTEFNTKKAQAPRLTAAWAEQRMKMAKECFAAARKANPKATLVINDYKNDAAYMKIIEQLKDEKGQRLYDVVGLQSHMHRGAWSNSRVWETCERFAGLGVPLHFTELTILSGKREAGKVSDGGVADAEIRWSQTSQAQQQQAEEAVRIYTMLFSHPSVEAITWWDSIDGYTWQQAPAGLLDAEAKPKPSYVALKKLIRETWWTHGHGTTNATGTFTARGFYGGYRVRVKVGEKVVAEGDFRLAKGEEGGWKLVVKP